MGQFKLSGMGLSFAPLMAPQVIFLPFASPNEQNQEARGVTLHLISTQGQTQSSSEIIKSTKQAVTVPTKYHKLGSQIPTSKVVLKYFLATLPILQST